MTVKIRSGWTPDNPTCVPFARAAEDAGVKAIAIHARFAHQGHSGDADWAWIKRVKETVSIPVIGNGDIHNADDARRMMDLTGCDGVMIGRAAMGNPWIFHQIAHELRTGEQLPKPTQQEIAEMAIKHARLTLETSQMPPGKTIRELRGQLLKYTNGVFEASRLREDIKYAQSMQDIEDAFLRRTRA